MNNEPKLIICSLDGQHYGLPLQAIQEIFLAAAITLIPNSPLELLGVINVHGDILPVVNIRQLLALKQKTPSSSDHFVLIQYSMKKLIFVFDSVLNSITSQDSTSSSLQPLPANNTHYLKGIIKKNHHLVFILDMEKLFSHTDSQIFETLSLQTGEKI